MFEQVIYKESVFIDEFKGDINLIDKHIQHIREFDKGRKISNEGGYQSHDITFGFMELLQHIQEGFNKLNKSVTLANFWLNINKPNDFNISHVHELGTWSVVYFHKVCCEQPTLTFHHLVPTIVQQSFNLVPKNQMLVFFRGMYPHSVKPCLTQNHERISVAFNYDKIRR